MTTLSEIATEVFDAVTGEIDGVIKSILIERIVPGEYDPTTGTNPETVQSATGRGLAETERAIKDSFPEYTITGAETLWFAAELGFAPKAGDKLTADGGVERRVVAVRDILENEELFRILVV